MADNGYYPKKSLDVHLENCPCQCHKSTQGSKNCLCYKVPLSPDTWQAVNPPPPPGSVFGATYPTETSAKGITTNYEPKPPQVNLTLLKQAMAKVDQIKDSAKIAQGSMSMHLGQRLHNNAKDVLGLSNAVYAVAKATPDAATAGLLMNLSTQLNDLRARMLVQHDEINSAVDHLGLGVSYAKESLKNLQTHPTAAQTHAYSAKKYLNKASKVLGPTKPALEGLHKEFVENKPVNPALKAWQKAFVEENIKATTWQQLGYTASSASPVQMNIEATTAGIDDALKKALPVPQSYPPNPQPVQIPVPPDLKDLLSYFDETESDVEPDPVEYTDADLNDAGDRPGSFWVRHRQIPGRRRMLRQAQLTIYGDSGSEEPLVNSVEEANIVTSEIPAPVLLPKKVWLPDTLKKIWHAPVIDLDFPATLVPSSTPGHYHLYLEHLVEASAYFDLLDALAAAGLVQEFYAAASRDRGYSAVRLPWVHKET